jgi:hypothetical protein
MADAIVEAKGGQTVVAYTKDEAEEVTDMGSALSLKEEKETKGE